ncbi:uncharacterized protein LOC117175021 [Belonocnema kinseyi]|uniref:uncharacterized protein LOC117175021 n=1 Tax=Belonocnema kinseyi TaxID=2817044 RepID=UPI00143D6ADF|nr:uncharacterized protein LOC117175021 [Belonocnema kinseyi]
MNKEKYKNTEFKNNNKFPSSIEKLNAYIACHEKNYGKIRMRDYSSNRNEKLSAALQNLKIAIEKDRIRKEEAFENLNSSNKIMKKAILKMREEVKSSRNNICEFQKLDDLNTERLLQVDPLQYLETKR